MPKTLAESFSEELENWNESIQFYSIEIESIDSKLYEVIRRNSIPGIAAKVNTYQVRLNNLSEQFDSILESIDDQ
jgi:prefoldin subunit 5